MIEVVAAVIQSGDRVLLARRAIHKAMAGKWEFPGGKIEANESPEAALIREISEEFGVKITLGDWICSHCHQYPDVTIKLSAYYASTKEKILESTDHDEIVWVLTNKLHDFDLAEADLPIAKLLN